MTEFLSVVADRPDGPAAQRAAVECAALALDADIAILMVDGAVAAAFGITADQVPLPELAEVGAGRRLTLDLPAGSHSVTYAEISGHFRGLLVLGRLSIGFTAEDVCLLRGMARVLELSLQALHMIESERRHTLENGRLTDSLLKRERLFEQLSHIQRAIARRAPLQQILDAVTVSAAELLDVETATLHLLERDDPTVAGLVAGFGVSPAVRAGMKQTPLASACPVALFLVTNLPVT